MTRFYKQCLAITVLSLLTANAWAHTGVLPAGGLADGFMHPFLGLDHLLAMLGVGLWAGTQQRNVGRQIVAVFLLYMLSGVLLGMHGVRFEYVETAILVSLVLIGALLAIGKVNFSKAICAGLIAVCAVMHGLAHGGEIPAAASAYAYLAGIMAATGLLHLAGMSLGLLLRRFNATLLAGVYGGATAAVGAWLLFAAG